MGFLADGGAARATACLLVPLLAAGAAAVGSAQPAAPAGDAAFGDIVDVEVVNVEVRVSDRRGDAITGLTREDFRLYEDGRPVELAYFSEVTTPSAAAVRDGRRSSRESAATVRELAPAASPRQFVIFLDFGHLTPAGMKKVLSDLEAFVEGLHPRDRVMVVERQQNLRVVAELTDDHARAAAAIAAAAETAPQGLDRVRERRSTLAELERVLGTDNDVTSCDYEEALEAEAVVRSHAAWIGAQVLGSVSALTSLSRALAGLPGDKTVLYVGEGLDQRPAVDLYHLLSELCPVRQQEIHGELTSHDLSMDFHRLAADANANRVTFYPLDAGGLRADGSIDAASARFRMPTIARRMGEANLKSPLFQIADQTGGRAVFDTNRFAEDLVEISEDAGRYYSLGFVPRSPGDGRIHTLRVELAARHHELRYRKAYRAKPQPERTVEAMLGALLFGVEENPLGIEVEAAVPTPISDGLFSVPIRIRVPLDDLTILPGVGFSVGRITLVLAALEEGGDWTPVRQRDEPFKVENDTAPTTPRLFEVTMELAPGRNLVAVGVRDEQGGEASYVRLPVEVGPAASSG